MDLFYDAHAHGMPFSLPSVDSISAKRECQPCMKGKCNKSSFTHIRAKNFICTFQLARTPYQCLIYVCGCERVSRLNRLLTAALFPDNVKREIQFKCRKGIMNNERHGRSPRFDTARSSQEYRICCVVCIRHHLRGKCHIYCPRISHDIFNIIIHTMCTR